MSEKPTNQTDLPVVPPKSPIVEEEPTVAGATRAITKSASTTPVESPYTDNSTDVDEIVPPKPPRPLTPQSQNQKTLEEAFPNIDPVVVKAILVASKGELEPAFNALLSMSDPSAVEQPPPQPPRPRAPQLKVDPSFPAEYLTSTPQSQLDEDRRYAQQLQKHYEAPAPHQNRNTAGQPQAHLPPRRHPNDESDDEYYHDDKDRPSFFEEDLPVIKENIKKGFLETQTKVTGWFNEFKKRIDGESPEASPPGSTRPSGSYSRSGTRRQTGLGDVSGRRSRDGAGYDADPKVLSDDFTHLDLKDNSGSERTLRRPKANPNLFQPSATAGRSGRRVSFEDRPTTINDDDLYRPSSATAKRSSVSPARQPSPVGGRKWEPLKSVDPEPIDGDPFSLGDSDDEKDGLVKETSGGPATNSGAIKKV